MIEGAQYVDGKVAVRYSQPTPKFVRVANSEYVCDVRYGIALLFVTEEEVPPLLAYEEGCNCGGSKRKGFALASELAVKVWQEGHY